MDRKVREVMHRGVVTCRVTATASEIAAIMADNDVSALVVTDERFDACGVVTETDLVAHYGQDLSAITAEDIMSAGLETVSPETLLWQAARQMLERKVHQLVIVTEGGVHRRPVGILTRGDVVALMAGQTGPRSAAQIRCSECIRRFLSAGGATGEADRLPPEARPETVDPAPRAGAVRGGAARGGTDNDETPRRSQEK